MTRWKLNELYKDLDMCMTFDELPLEADSSLVLHHVKYRFNITLFTYLFCFKTQKLCTNLENLSHSSRLSILLCVECLTPINNHLDNILNKFKHVNIVKRYLVCIFFLILLYFQGSSFYTYFLSIYFFCFIFFYYQAKKGESMSHNSP